jgi:hypothetical protein
MLKKGNPIPIEINDNLIKCPMPTGHALAWLRDLINPYLNDFPRYMESSGFGKWREAKIMSGDQTEFWVIIHRVGTMSDTDAHSYAFSSNAIKSRQPLQPLQYTDEELQA